MENMKSNISREVDFPPIKLKLEITFESLSEVEAFHYILSNRPYVIRESLSDLYNSLSQIIDYEKKQKIE